MFKMTLILIKKPKYKEENNDPNLPLKLKVKR